MRQPALANKLDGRVLQAAFGNSETEHAHERESFPYTAFGIKRALGDDFGFAVRGNLAEKAGAVAFVADAGPERIDANQQRVHIAIDANLAHFQHVAALLALAPQFVARAAEECDFPALSASRRTRRHS